MYVRPGKRSTLARRGTALVIEGYPRSGNTYSVAAFTVANGEHLAIGRHLHGAPHVLRAVRLGIPTILLIREPAAAVSSYLVRRPALTAVDALREYLDFYGTTWKVRDRVVVGRFDQVVRDFGVVLEAVNQRFGTSFAPYRPTESNEAAAFRLVEEMNRRECRGEIVESHVGRPSRQRETPKQAIRVQLGHGRAATLLDEATALYHRYAALAPGRDPSAPADATTSAPVPAPSPSSPESHAAPPA